MSLRIVLGPAHYLFGEETALLEVIDGRDPFPRVAPPFRRGIALSDTAADLELATEDGSSAWAPALVNNVETLANVPGIVTNGPDWVRPDSSCSTTPRPR